MLFVTSELRAVLESKRGLDLQGGDTCAMSTQGHPLSSSPCRLKVLILTVPLNRGAVKEEMLSVLVSRVSVQILLSCFVCLFV